MLIANKLLAVINIIAKHIGILFIMLHSFYTFADPPISSVFRLAIDGQGALYAATSEGFYISRNGAESWQITLNEKSACNDILATRQGQVYAKNCSSLFSSADSKTWKVIFNKRVVEFAIDAKNNLFVFGDDGLFVGKNGGSVWEKISPARFSALYKESPQFSGKIFASAIFAVNDKVYIYDLHREKLFVTSSVGEKWDGFDVPPSQASTSFIFDEQGSFYASPTFYKTYKNSLDMKSGWEEFKTPVPMRMLAAKEGKIFAQTDDGRLGIMTVSTKNWQYLKSPTPNVASLVAMGSLLVISDGNTNGRIFRSKDGGKTWMGMDLNFGNWRRVAP